MRTLKVALLFVVIFLVVNGIYHVYKPLPAGIDYEGEIHPASQVRFLADIAYENEQGERVLRQEIFDAVLEMISTAEEFILLDMFLFNSFQGVASEQHRVLSDELTMALLSKKLSHPNIEIQVISDPINTVYGGLQSTHFNSLENAGIPVTLTDLTRLRDSNPVYSAVWRPFIRPLGNSDAGMLPNPFGRGQVSLRSYLALLNFKANHRKLIIADAGGELMALVTSANPHDGSSAHGNVALQFAGPAAYDLLSTELAVLAFSGASAPQYIPQPEPRELNTEGALQIITERAVERALLSLIDGAQEHEQLDLAVFYLSDRHIVNALKSARARGVQVRVLLDPNKDAFGREKNGVPNRPVAHELVRSGVEVRWCNTQGEQCHAKWLMHQDLQGNATMVLGSTNFTRRNMHNLNLETSVVLRGSAQYEPLQHAHQWFEAQWHNSEERNFTVEYEVYASEKRWHQLLYRVMEATGLSTF